MKKVRISTLGLAMCLLLMSMGFPHPSAEEKGGLKNSRSVVYSGFWSCTAHPAGQEQMPVKPEMKSADISEKESNRSASRPAVLSLFRVR
jgi:hypothetical protein